MSTVGQVLKRVKVLELKQQILDALKGKLTTTEFPGVAQDVLDEVAVDIDAGCTALIADELSRLNNKEVNDE